MNKLVLLLVEFTKFRLATCSLPGRPRSLPLHIQRLPNSATAKELQHRRRLLLQYNAACRELVQVSRFLNLSLTHVISCGGASRNLVSNLTPSTLSCRNKLRSWNDNVTVLILSRDLGLHGCYNASFIVPSTLPTTGFFRLQADETELLTASACHVLTGPHVLNQHAARYACAEGGATYHSNNFLPGAIT